ncbi:phosphodiester glycosidase family protein [Gellertiella hungarica]|uniref:Uncharacterized protein YigE (DUF2233 family) n=1 Tax=Gellertiella hungarica TaxID=1572859 RepID=A0A7W6J8S8_9HYPH|nr:phosphodiester glycosidase family protein [Gellertiella hungarica]MBB4066926.1 uncharacterized protein YigE (DUF2233 family) [Gellertiella hungarica]
MTRFLFFPSLLVLWSLWLFAPAQAAEDGCRRLEHKAGRYIVCTFDPGRASIALFNRGTDGKPYGRFDPLFQALLSRGELPVFAMNGGMYEEDLSPVGLYVEKGMEQKAANLRGGYGNFHLKPNGVFWLSAGKAGVTETRAFLKRRKPVDYATQSGPLLVWRNRLHPALLPDSDSFKIRNGVGIDGQGRVHFVISEDAVRFHDLATLFRDILKCPDALFLDGSISSLYAPELGRFDRFFPMGPIIAVTVRWPFSFR